MRDLEPTTATLWLLRFSAFAGFAVGVAIVAAFMPTSVFFEPPSISTAFVLLAGNTLRVAAGATCVGISLSSGQEAIRFRPLLAVAAAGAVKVAACTCAVVSVSRAYARHASFHTPPSRIIRMVVAEEVGTVAVAFAVGSATALLAILVVTRTVVMRRTQPVVVYVLERPWLACLIAGLVLQALTGRQGTDSYGFGLPLPFSDTYGSGVPWYLAPILLLFDATILGMALFGTHRSLRWLRSSARRQR